MCVLMPMGAAVDRVSFFVALQDGVCRQSFLSVAHGTLCLGSLMSEGEAWMAPNTHQRPFFFLGGYSSPLPVYGVGAGPCSDIQ